MNTNLRAEFGKWFLDVAKYVATAMLLTSMVEGIAQPAVTIIAVLFLTIALSIGAMLISSAGKQEERRQRNRNKNRKNK